MLHAFDGVSEKWLDNSMAEIVGIVRKIRRKCISMIAVFFSQSRNQQQKMRFYWNLIFLICSTVLIQIGGEKKKQALTLA